MGEEKNNQENKRETARRKALEEYEAILCGEVPEGFIGNFFKQLIFIIAAIIAGTILRHYIRHLPYYF